MDASMVRWTEKAECRRSRTPIIRVAVADPCPLIRLAMKQILRKARQFTFAWETDKPLLLHQFLQKRPVPLLVLEPLVRDNRDALRRLDHLHRDFPSTVLLVYTHAADD